MKRTIHLNGYPAQLLAHLPQSLRRNNTKKNTTKLTHQYRFENYKKKQKNLSFHASWLKL